MGNLLRKLDNTAKAFSLEAKKNKNTFRLSVILTEEVDANILKLALIKTLDIYPSYKVRMKSGLFWNYLEFNPKEILVEEENELLSSDLKNNNDYLFKVTYFNNKINLDIFHVLTDGTGAIIFLKGIIYNYLNLVYGIELPKDEIVKNVVINQDEYLVKADKSLVCKRNKSAYLIKGKSNFYNNKTYHYVFNLEKFKIICKKHNASITEFLTAIYIFALYRSIYNKLSSKDIVVTVPIDLRKRFNVESFSNFFTCMNIEGKVINNKNATFKQILSQVREEFLDKLTFDNIKKYLARDVKLGTNAVIQKVPLMVKKVFMKYLEKFVNQTYTTTLSNIGQIKLDEKFKKYVENIRASVNAGILQKVKCTICSYENNLTVTLNSNLLNGNLEKEFYKLLRQYIGEFSLETY